MRTPTRSRSAPSRADEIRAALWAAMPAAAPGVRWLGVSRVRARAHECLADRSVVGPCSRLRLWDYVLLVAHRRPAVDSRSPERRPV